MQNLCSEKRKNVCTYQVNICSKKLLTNKCLPAIIKLQNIRSYQFLNYIKNVFSIKTSDVQGSYYNIEKYSILIGR